MLDEIITATERLQFGRGFDAAETATLVMTRDEHEKLQFGRGFDAAETPLFVGHIRLRPAASIRPRL